MSTIQTKKRKKWLKWILAVTGAVLTVIVMLYFLADNPRPVGIKGTEADALAVYMLTAINDNAWQNTGAVSWTFAGRRRLVWDKKRQYTRVSWGNYEVFVDINTKTGSAYENGIQKQGDEAAGLIEAAWKIWVNDAFWLNPISKVFDPGTTRRLVNLESGNKGLLVEYDEGGATPGDAYLWEVGSNGLPLNWKMWVSNIPVGGMKASWENWIVCETGVKIATSHVMPVMTLKITEVETAADVVGLMGEDIFLSYVEEILKGK